MPIFSRWLSFSASLFVLHHLEVFDTSLLAHDLGGAGPERTVMSVGNLYMKLLGAVLPCPWRTWTELAGDDQEVFGLHDVDIQKNISK